MTYNPTFPKALKGSHVAEWFQDHLTSYEPLNSAVYTELKRRAMLVSPEGFPMTIRNQVEWAPITEAVNEGIDAYLEGFTRSKFDNGNVWLHPEEIHILVRRMSGNATTRGNTHYEEYVMDGGDVHKYESPDDEGERLAQDIVYVMLTDD